jgi:YHS domain-containing protein
MQIVPDYTFDNAPPPKVIVIPAQRGASDAMLAWIRTQSAATDVTMSVCTGAFVLAKTGLLDGKRATTYHNAFDVFEAEHPNVKLLRGLRFVDDGNVSSAGGLSSGIDLALHVVERYYGRDVATAAAFDLEYQGPGWRDPGSNNVYATMAKPKPQPGHVLCPVCSMDADPRTAPSSVYAGKTYYFCSPDDKQTFDATPAKFAARAPG